MQKIIAYDINEIIVLVVSVVIGTGAYIGFMLLKKQKDVSFGFVVAVLFINLLVTHVASEVLKRTSLSDYRAPMLPAIAYLGQYFMEWLDKRYLKIFDAGAKKVGLDIDNSDDNTVETNKIDDESKE